MIMGQNSKASELISKFLLNQITDSEKMQLKEWVNASEENKAKFIELTDIDKLLSKAYHFFGVKEKERQKG